MSKITEDNSQHIGQGLINESTIIQQTTDGEGGLDAVELTMSNFSLLSSQQPTKDEWTSVHDYNFWLKKRLAKKWNQQHVDEVQRQKELFRVVLGAEVTRNKVEGEAREIGASMPLNGDGTGSFLNSEDRHKWVAKRAITSKGREGDVGFKRAERDWSESSWFADEGGSWAGEEDADEDFEERSVDITWEQQMLREHGQVKNYCRKASTLRNSWTIRSG